MTQPSSKRLVTEASLTPAITNAVAPIKNLSDPAFSAALSATFASRAVTQAATYYPENYGTVTYGKDVSSAAATANAVAIQAAITAASVTGGRVIINRLIEVRSTDVAAIILPGGVHLYGMGVGGDIYSGTDAQLPFQGSVLRLNSGANQDLVRTLNFATLTGVSSPSAYSTPARFGLHHLVLDGNKANNTTGLPLRIFGRTYIIDGVIIQNGASGGVYSEYGAGGYEMEARWSDFTITDCAGDGLEWRGPHDSLFSNGLVARNDGHNGVNLVVGTYIGGEMFNNIHVWGNHTYQWVIGGTNAAFLNCVSDGPGGVQVIGSGNTWLGGSIYGSNTPGEVAITLGDGTTRTVGTNTLRTRVFNYAKGSMLNRLTLNTTPARNIYQLAANMGGNSRYTGGSGKSTLASVTTFPAASIAVTDATTFPTSGQVYIGDGTNITVATYTGKTGNTLTGATGGSGTFAAGAPIFSLSTSAAGDTWEVTDTDGPALGFFQTAQLTTTLFSRVFLESTSFNVGTQILRPNSSTTALQHLRNETSRVDMAWDNSGTAGAYSYQNGATVEGRTGTTSGTKTWKLNSALGTVQTGSAVTASRPSASTAGAGAMFYDTTLSKPIWSDGTVWRDAAGTAA